MTDMGSRRRALVGIMFVLVGLLIVLLVTLDFVYPISYIGQVRGHVRGSWNPERYRTPEELKDEQRIGDLIGGLLGVVAIAVGGAFIRENVE